MKAGRPIAAFVGASLLVLALGPAVQAEDVEKKWRLSLSLGGYNANDDVESPSANELILVDPCLRTLTCPAGVDVVTHFFRDPRNDSGAFGNLDMQAAALGTVHVQYALSKMFIVEGSVGYQKGDLGDVDVSVQFIGDSSELDEITFNFNSFRVSAGELERIPIQLSLLARMRPRASFNPYFGGGIGYSIIGYEASPEFNDLSQTLDAQRGIQLRLTNAIAARPALVTDSMSAEDLQGATVDARDTFEWHLAAGFEYTFKAKWSVFTDLRWVDASRSLRIGFDTGDELGLSVPNLVSFNDTEFASNRYGPVQVGSCSKLTGCTPEGLLDEGQVFLVPIETADPGHICEVGVNDPQCELDFIHKADYDTHPAVPDDFVPDGNLDPGAYFVHGGEVSYDGYSLQIGVRYTF